MDLRDTGRLMQILREEKAWPRDHTMICRTCPLNVLFGGHFSRPDNPGVQFIPSAEGRENYKRAVTIINERAKKEGWPEIAFECLGEFTNFGESGRMAVGSTISATSASATLPAAMALRHGPDRQGLVKYPSRTGP